MPENCGMPWRHMTVEPDRILDKIRPGMSLFLSTAVAEPRTMLEYLKNSDRPNLQDLELIQVVNPGVTLSLDDLKTHKFRLKTFFSGWASTEAIETGVVDLIPSRFSRIPLLIESGRLNINTAVVQITPPNSAGYVSLGLAVDVARRAMERAQLVVGEINPWIPRTLGDTFAHISDFDFFVTAEEPPVYIQPWPRDEVFDRVAENVASFIEDGACLAFSVGPIYDALIRKLVRKKHLGIHTPFLTDSVMELIESGAVTNRLKKRFRGKSLTSYALGTKKLLEWLDQNPLVEFQPVEKVWDPVQFGENKRFIAVIPARKVDLTGGVALHLGKMNVATGPSEVIDMVNGAEMSEGGLSIVALPSRNRKGEPNIVMSVDGLHNIFGLPEAIDLIATEYGVASINGRTVREQAQAIIDIAHPEDRADLVEKAKAAHLIYADQIYLYDSAHLYPSEIATSHTFKGGVHVRFRAIKPSDEEEMRRLFYRFSDEAVYYRYFTPIKAMPHARMQTYVNVDYRQTMSIVAVVGEPGRGHIIGEARYVRIPETNFADVAFVVDEEYQGLGIASHMFNNLLKLAKERGIKGFTADVLSSNKAMMKVFERAGLQIKATLDAGAYHLEMPFEAEEGA